MIDFVRNQDISRATLKPAKAVESLLKLAYSLHCKGDTLFIANRYAEAWEIYQNSMQAYQQGNDLQGVALSLTRLGRVAEIQGEYSQARELYLKAMDHFENLSDLQGMARAKAHLGNIGWATGDYADAGKLLQDALSLYRVAEDVPGEAWVYDLLGNLRLAMRQDEEAEQFYQTAFSLVQTLGVNLENRSWNFYHLGALGLFRGEAVEAKERFLEALKGFVKLKDGLGQTAALTHLAEIACAQRNGPETEHYLAKAVKLITPTGCKPLVADVLTGIAQYLKLQGNERKAITILMVALSHRTCRQQTKDRMVSLAASLEANLSPKEIAEGFNWAKTVPLEEMAGSWAASVANKAKK